MELVSRILPILMITTVAVVSIINLKRRIRDLEFALTAKSALSWDEEAKNNNTYHLYAGDTLRLSAGQTVITALGNCNFHVELIR